MDDFSGVAQKLRILYNSDSSVEDSHPERRRESDSVKAFSLLVLRLQGARSNGRNISIAASFDTEQQPDKMPRSFARR